MKEINSKKLFVEFHSQPVTNLRSLQSLYLKIKEDKTRTRLESFCKELPKLLLIIAKLNLMINSNLLALADKINCGPNDCNAKQKVLLDGTCADCGDYTRQT